jgi:uncharacterized protein (DUF58 family)
VISEYWLLIVVLLIVAALVRGDFAFTILYLLIGTYVLGRWWAGQTLRKVLYKRVYEQRAFLGEDIPVRLEIYNRSMLPAVWMHFHDSLPVELAPPNLVNQVVTLGPYGHASLEYVLHTRKRGYYQIGPLFTSTGDLLGLSDEQQSKGQPDYLTVYPKIVSFSNLKLPSYSPLGTLRSNQPIFEDPTRVLSKRDYVAGDSLRRIDWKTSAIIGRLQVKQFKPSIALETMIFLNLNAAEYMSQYRIDSTELAIVIAASLANWLIAQKQSVGLIANGVDPLGTDQSGQHLLARKGQGHLIRILELLARIQSDETFPIAELLRYQNPHLSWGTTIILILGMVDEALFDEIFQARRRGLNVVMIIAGRIADVRNIQHRARYFGIPVYAFQSEMDLDVWRK